MIFYEVEDGSNGHFLVATQADAKREARERKCTWSQVDVPTDKAGLMTYVNGLKAQASQLLALAEHEGTMPAAEPQPVTISATSVQLDEQTNVEDYILNRATVTQVENLFSRLGTRFKELAQQSSLLT